MELALAAAIPSLIGLRDQGVIGAVGVGMNLVAPPRQLASETDIDVAMAAGRWTLPDRSAAVLVDLCKQRAIVVVAERGANLALRIRRHWLLVGDDRPDCSTDSSLVGKLVISALEVAVRCLSARLRSCAASTMETTRAPTVTTARAIEPTAVLASAVLGLYRDVLARDERTTRSGSILRSSSSGAALNVFVVALL